MTDRTRDFPAVKEAARAAHGQLGYYRRMKEAMTDDIVKRLRGYEFYHAICREAADEIERLRADAARYRWLRSWMGRQDEAPDVIRTEPESPEALDVAIDAAISQESR